MRRSGIHFDACNDEDLLKIVNNIVDQNALSEEKGQKNKTFRNYLSSHLQNNDKNE